MNDLSPSQASQRGQASDVLLVGPPLDAVGGMAEMMRLTLGMDYRDRYRLRTFSTTQSTGTGERAFNRVRRHLAHASAFRRLLKQTQPAIVHLHTCSGFSFFRALVDQWIARRQGGRTILHIHGGRFAAFLDELGPVRRRIAIRGLHAADRVVVLSRHWRAQILRIAPAARVAVIENGIEIPPRILAPSHEGPCRFIMLGSLDRLKGVNDLIDACARLRRRGIPFHVTIAGPPGDAGDATVMARKIAERDLTGDVQYIGTVLGEAKLDRIRTCDAYLQPSHYEGLPLGVLEAMSFARPVVATTVGALPEMIMHECEGLLVPPHHPEALAAAMARLAQDPATRARMGAAARSRVRERFSLESMRAKVLALYDELTGRTVERSVADIAPANLDALRFAPPAPSVGTDACDAAPSDLPVGR